jgi:hypothetical protein
MPEFFATGDEIGTFTGLTSSGNSNGTQVTLTGVQPLGGPTDVFRIVVRQVNQGSTLFSNGQMVDIYAWPDTNPPAPPLYSSLNPQHDQFQGRASSGTHQIITSPARIVFDVNGITAGTMQFGPGANPPRSEQLSFTTFSPTPPVFPCFVAGTLIDTASGPRQIEVLTPGDMIRTADHGLQPLRWIGQRKVPARGLLAPIRIAAGALGNQRDLLVSPQHRMLVQGWQAELHFGVPQVLVAALHLVNDRTIRRHPQDSVTYVHLAFDRHEVIFAEGCPSESLHLGNEAMQSLGHDTRQELLTVFPELAAHHLRPRPTARTCLRGWESALLTPPPRITTGKTVNA